MRQRHKNERVKDMNHEQVVYTEGGGMGSLCDDALTRLVTFLSFCQSFPGAEIRHYSLSWI